MLRGHLARANPQWRNLQAEVEALAIFHGPEAYVSPSWYPGKATHAKVVPTWNYVQVEARGPLQVFDDAQALRAFLARLTAAHESGRPAPWRLEDAPADYLDAQLRAIVGIEIPVRALNGKWKMSQNKDAAERAGVKDGLASAGRGDVADLI